MLTVHFCFRLDNGVWIGVGVGVGLFGSFTGGAFVVIILRKKKLRSVH